MAAVRQADHRLIRMDVRRLIGLGRYVRDADGRGLRTLRRQTREARMTGAVIRIDRARALVDECYG